MRRSSSPANGWLIPPLRKKVTCAYFSDFGDAQLAQPCSADDLAQGVRYLARRERHRQVFELFVVKRKRHEREVAELRPREAIKSRLRKCLGQLNFPLAAAAAEDDRVPIRDPADRRALCVHGDQRFERVVGLARAIRRSDGLSEGGGAVGEMIGGHKQPYPLEPRSSSPLRSDRRSLQHLPGRPTPTQFSRRRSASRWLQRFQPPAFLERSPTAR